MALQTSFIVIPFVAGVRGVHHPGVPRRSLTQTSAIDMAEALAPFHAGVIVLADRNDPVAGIFLEPSLVCVIGDVPADLLRQPRCLIQGTRTASSRSTRASMRESETPIVFM